jgi:gliding motility-associated-like protein
MKHIITNSKKVHLILTFILLYSLQCIGQVAEYSFESTISVTSSDANVTASDASGGNDDLGCYPVYYSGNPGDAAATHMCSSSGDFYYEITITPDAGYSIDFSTITWDADRSGTGPQNWYMRSSLDGYSSDIGSGTNPSSFGGQSVSTGASFDNITSAVTFRIYNTNVSSSSCNCTSGGSIRIDNLTFNGTVNVACSDPSSDVDNISFPSTGGFDIQIDWSNNGAENALVQISEDGTFDISPPSDGTAPPATNSIYSGADQWVYAGGSETVTVEGLSQCTQYYFKIWAYNCDGSNAQYKAVSNATGNETTTVGKPAQATNLTFHNISGNSMELRWDEPAGGCEGYMVKIRTTDNGFANFSPGAEVGAGSFSPWEDEDTIFTSSSQRYLVISDLDENKTYYYKVYAYNSCGGAFAFNNDNDARGSQKTKFNSTDKEVCANEDISFIVNMADTNDISFQWKVKSLDSSTYSDVTDGVRYSGAKTDKLTIHDAPATMNGYQYYCLIIHKAFNSAVTDPPNNCTALTRAATLTVHANPLKPVVKNVDYNCGNSVLTRGTPPSGVTWYWQDGNSNGTSTANSDLDTTVVDEDTYCLRAQSDEGCWSDNSAEELVEIKQIPVANVSKSEGCDFGSVIVDSDLSGIQAFELRNGGGDTLSPHRTWNGNATSHEFGGLHSGDYQAYVTKDGCISAVSSTITLSNTATPFPSEMADSSICGDGNVTMVANASADVEFSLDGSTVDSTDNSSPYTYTVPLSSGNEQIVYARANNGGCTSEWVTATARSLEAVGQPTAIEGVNTPRSQKDTTETYTTSATNVDYFTWEIQNATAGSDYTFLGSASTVSEQVEWNSAYSGTTNIRVMAHNTCGSSGYTEAILNITASISIASQPVAEIVCENATASFTITADGTPPYGYQWQKDNGGNWDDLSDGGNISGALTDQLDIADASAGDADSYRCVVSNASGDSIISDEVALTVNALPVPVLASNIHNDTICAGESVTFTESSGTGTNFDFYLNGSSVQNSSNNEYITSALSNGDQVFVVVSNAGGCADSTDTINTIVNELPLVSAGNDTSIAYESAAMLSGSASGGSGVYNYQWSPTDSVVDPNIKDPQTEILHITNQFTFEVTDDNTGCQASSTVIINVTKNLINIIADIDSISCSGNADASITVNPEGGFPPYQYLWSTGDTTQQISDLSAGTYTVTITDDMEYIGVRTFYLSNPNPIYVNEYLTHISCYDSADGSISIANVYNADHPVEYLWDNGAQDNILTGLEKGDYQLTITDISGCKFDTSYFIVEPDSIYVFADITDESAFGKSDGEIELDSVKGGKGNYNLNWSNGDTSDLLSGLDAGYYILIITDDNGCKRQYTYTVEIGFIPTAFSPDGNNINDKWEIPEFTENYPQGVVYIYDRWGQLVFASQKGYPEDNYWNGKHNGEILPEDAYHYIIFLNNGADKCLTGQVTIIRQ